MTRYTDTLNAAFADYGMRFRPQPTRNGRLRAHGITEDAGSALDVVGDTPIVSMTLLGSCATPAWAARNGQLAQRILQALIPGWSGVEAWMVETLTHFAQAEDGEPVDEAERQRIASQTIEQVQDGYRIQATWHRETKMLVLHVEQTT